ncbi:MAG: prephenate dehydrogenase/arogenate dehydrogenase family protein [Chloroflexi bacterium]|nr:prephenate dehydrogenase/arogenate dehydrogenase family protein [Chloroflexota bacterium]MCY4247135.1 prephenate dehydrogenase/arogenate dehydrogenase family protein [Chloroflexota bacterium]
MAELTVAILGLDRLGLSIALRLRAYTEKGGRHRFILIGHDSRDDFEKPARKQKVFAKFERKIHVAVETADVVIMNLPYEDLRAGYEWIGSSLRDGVVILDTAAVKQPSLAWAADLLGDEHHVIGFTPIINADYMLDHRLEAECASDDYFHECAIYLTPGLRSLSEAIDLAANFAVILGAKPHFLDAAEHDSLTALTEGIPQVLSIAAYRATMSHSAWADAQRLTNPPFNVLTRYLLTHHPDALRDEWLANRDGLGRAIDQLIVQLRELRGALADHDEDAIEAFLIAASDDYQLWINRRHKGGWNEQPGAKAGIESTIAGSLFGGAITRRLFGDKDNNR